VTVLCYRAPYDWPAILNFLRPRAIAGVEVVSDDAYERGAVRVTHAPNAIIVNDASHADRVRSMFDVDADIAEIQKLFARDKVLGPLMKKHPGIRVPGAWDPFEMAIRAIVGQQISVAGATTLMARIASRHGVTPESLMRARTNPGMPRVRWNCIRGLARAEVVFERGATLDESIANLTKLPGIGPWTAHYIAMRALREPDAFPHTDLGIRKPPACSPTASCCPAPRHGVRIARTQRCCSGAASKIFTRTRRAAENCLSPRPRVSA